MKLTFVFTILLVLVATSSQASAESCTCGDNYDPVCGQDGQTYGNLCNLQCAKGQLAYRGQCREG